MLRWAHGIRLLYIHRAYTDLVNQIPLKDRQRFCLLADLEPDGSVHLSPAFEKALGAATAAATTRHANTTPLRRP